MLPPFLNPPSLAYFAMIAPPLIATFGPVMGLILAYSMCAAASLAPGH